MSLVLDVKYATFCNSAILCRMGRDICHACYIHTLSESLSQSHYNNDCGKAAKYTSWRQQTAEAAHSRYWIPKGTKHWAKNFRFLPIYGIPLSMCTSLTWQHLMNCVLKKSQLFWVRNVTKWIDRTPCSQYHLYVVEPNTTRQLWKNTAKEYPSHSLSENTGPHQTISMFVELFVRVSPLSPDLASRPRNSLGTVHFNWEVQFHLLPYIDLGHIVHHTDYSQLYTHSEIHFNWHI